MVTLVVPIYNMERYLPRCVDSILAQTSREFEVVLVDDGSTDHSGSLCDAYATGHPELIRVIHKPNGGLSSARNAGIDAAQGEFIVFPDPDDWVEPDYVESLLQVQREYRADLVCLGYYVDTDHSSVPGNQLRELAVLTGREGQRGLLLNQKMQGFCWNKLYRMEIIRSHGLRFPQGMGSTEDLSFTYDYLSYCQVVCHAPSRRVYHYYQRKDSTTGSNFSRERLGTIRTFEYIIADSGDNDRELARIAADELCTAAVNLLWYYENSGIHDPESQSYLLHHIRRCLPEYLRSSNYGIGRKLQALLASLNPKIYMHIKNAARRQSSK